MPGAHHIALAFAARITSASPCGMTISRPPALATSSTCAALITVPAPSRQRSPSSRASSSMLRSGCGEFSGTSMMRKPGLGQRQAHRHCLVRRDAAQDGDQRQWVQVLAHDALLNGTARPAVQSATGLPRPRPRPAVCAGRSNSVSAAGSAHTAPHRRPAPAVHDRRAGSAQRSSSPMSRPDRYSRLCSACSAPPSTSVRAENSSALAPAAARAAQRRHAALEGCVRHLAAAGLARRAAQDRMLAQQREQLAGHVGVEVDDAPVLDLHPLAVRARQDQQRALCRRRPAVPARRPPAFLRRASRRAGHRPGARRARCAASHRARASKRSSCAARAAASAGQSDVGHLMPALCAADHARGNDRQFRR